MMLVKMRRVLCWTIAFVGLANAWWQHSTTNRVVVPFISRTASSDLNLFGGGKVDQTADDDETATRTKFGMTQRLDSLKSGIVGAVAGSFGSTILIALHDESWAQWEFDTDAAAVSGALFCICYRYCIRMDSDNPQLAQGVIGSFCIVRTLARLQTSLSCSALPLQCGPPFEYLNYEMLAELLWSGAESVAIFGVAAWALETATERGFISRFPG